MFEKLTALTTFMEKGGLAIWVLAALAALTAGLILWKALKLVTLRALSPAPAERAVSLWLDGKPEAARSALGQGNGLYRAPVLAGLMAADNDDLQDAEKREEIARVASLELGKTRAGLRGLELIATIAPLVGLLGTVLGMVAAFQALEAAGSRADPSDLAGGIWEALLTTAVGMGVAIPASAALTWFETIADRAQGRIEDMATRILLAAKSKPEIALQAAE